MSRRRGRCFGMIDQQKLDEIEQYVRHCVDNDLGLPGVELLSSKWLLRILFHLGRKSPWRFGALKRRLPGISNTALAGALRELTEWKLVHREQYNELPLRVEYSITDAGRELLELDYQLIQWEKKYCRE